MSHPAPPPGHSARARPALMRLAEADPAFAALSLWVAHRDADDPGPAQGRLDTEADAPAWTDGRAIYYGPGFTALDADLQVGVAAHQILHVALRHPTRAQTMALRLGDRADGQIFNIAADALVNETLLAAGYALPRPCVTLTALHAFVVQDAAPPAEALAKWDVEALTLALIEARGQGRTAAAGSGEAPHSAQDAVVEAARQAGFAPDLDEPSGEGEGGEARSADEEDAEWRQRLSRALEDGRMAGRGIGTLGFRIADIPTSSVPWERHLRNLVARALRPEARPAWSRPSRRWTGMEAAARARGTAVPVFEPGQARDRTVPRLAVGIDASSSVDDARLGLFVGQVAGIARRAGAELHVIVFDDGVRRIERLPLSGAEEALRRLPLARGGGTDFAPVFEAAAALDPALLVVLTDLDAPVPPPPAGFDVLWAVPEPPRTRPRHGRVLDLSH